MEYHTTRTDEIPAIDEATAVAITIANWQGMRQYAIEIGLLAERQLIELGHMTAKERQVFTRKERRNGLDK